MIERAHTHTHTDVLAYTVYRLLPKMCHQMSQTSASFNLALHPVIIPQMATSSPSVSVSLTLFHITSHHRHT